MIKPRGLEYWLKVGNLHHENIVKIEEAQQLRRGGVLPAVVQSLGAVKNVRNLKHAISGYECPGCGNTDGSLMTIPDTRKDLIICTAGKCKYAGCTGDFRVKHYSTGSASKVRPIAEVVEDKITTMAEGYVKAIWGPAKGPPVEVGNPLPPPVVDVDESLKRQRDDNLRGIFG